MAGLRIGVFVLLCGSLWAQPKYYDLPLAQVPPEVTGVLDAYLQALRHPQGDSCLKQVTAIAGGSLLEDDKPVLRTGIRTFELKNDRDHIKLYVQPVVVARVNRQPKRSVGMGKNALRGDLYRIWLKPLHPQATTPGYLEILDPETGAAPRLVGIGNF